MTERRYTRAEFEAELGEVGYAGHQSVDGIAPDPASRRLLSWFDSVQLDLGHVGALYASLKEAISEKVAAEVRAEEAEQRILHLERQLAAKRVESEEEDEE